MTFDPKSISPEAKAELVDLGRAYGSEDTLTQARLTQNAYALHGPALANHGYAPSDAAELADYEHALIDAGIAREQSRAGKKSTNFNYLNALHNAKNVHARAIAVAKNTKAALLKAGNASEQIGSIQSVLLKSAPRADSADALATQLELFVPLLKDSIIADAAKDRGGPQLLSDIETSVPSLRSSSKAGNYPRGTPAHTELLDLLDGLIVENCRAARRAARSASRELGEEAVAKAFELNALRYGNKNPKPPASSDSAPK